MGCWTRSRTGRPSSDRAELDGDAATTARPIAERRTAAAAAECSAACAPACAAARLGLRPAVVARASSCSSSSGAPSRPSASSVSAPPLVFIIGWTGPPPTFNMAGKAMEGVEVRRTWVALKDVSPHIVRAVIAAEDQAFCTHDGFDREGNPEGARGGRARPRPARRIHHLAADRQERLPVQRRRLGAQGFRGLLHRPRRDDVVEAADHGDLSQRRRMGRWHLRRRTGGAGTLQVSAKNLTPRQAAALAAVLPNPNRGSVDGSYATGRRGPDPVADGRWCSATASIPAWSQGSY